MEARQRARLRLRLAVAALIATVAPSSLAQSTPVDTEDDASGLDRIQHVGASGKWWGIVAADGTPDGEPVVHGDGDPAFCDKNPHVHQGAIVENERLAAVLSKLRDDRRERADPRANAGARPRPRRA